jgi:hypothetical protein
MGTPSMDSACVTPPEIEFFAADPAGEIEDFAATDFLQKADGEVRLQSSIDALEGYSDMIDLQRILAPLAGRRHPAACHALCGLVGLPCDGRELRTEFVLPGYRVLGIRNLDPRRLRGESTQPGMSSFSATKLDNPPPSARVGSPDG